MDRIDLLTFTADINPNLHNLNFMGRVAVHSLTTNTSMVFLKLQIQECFKTFELYNFMYCHFRTMYYYCTMYIHGLFLTTIFYFIYKVFKHVFRLYTVHSTLHRFQAVLYFNLFIIYLFICYETNKFFFCCVLPGIC